MKFNKPYWEALFEAKPNERILDLPITKISVKVFLVMLLFTATPCLWYAFQLPFDFTPTGISYLFFDVLKVPLSLAGFFLSILGLIGLNHRSEQTQEQIKLTRLQANFTNHFKNQEEFIKHVQSSVPEWVLRQSDIRIFYQNLFPNSEMGDLTPSYSWIESVYQSLQDDDAKTDIPVNHYLDFRRLTSMLLNDLPNDEKRNFEDENQTNKYVKILCWLNDIFTFNAQTLDSYNQVKDVHRSHKALMASNCDNLDNVTK